MVIPSPHRTSYQIRHRFMSSEGFSDFVLIWYTDRSALSAPWSMCKDTEEERAQQLSLT